MPNLGCVGRSQRVEVLVALEVSVPDPGVHPLEAEPVSSTRDWVRGKTQVVCASKVILCVPGSKVKQEQEKILATKYKRSFSLPCTGVS